MADNVVPHKAQMPALDMKEFAGKLITGIAESRAATITPGGKPILRLLKSGEWAFGPANEEVQEGSHWFLNLATLGHGWVCWSDYEGNQKNEILGEILVSITQPKPARPPAVDGFEFNELRSFELTCMDGSDAGTEAVTKISSIGGMRAFADLVDAIQARLRENPEYSFPILTLEKDSYKHTKWGQIFTPVFNISGYADMNGKSYPAEEQLAEGGADVAALGEAEPENKPATKSKKPRLVAVEEPAPAPAPAPTAANRVGQRRRPGR
jgi:hypothetical protein